ncbi:hypothetical protein FB451DRAFT_1377464 [Mycena latifolia]|nr:hypothetical protein FB451DRAFT_1377464 [Mycena latifolia]
MILQPSQDETNTVLRVIQELPHLFLDDIQQELSTSHGLTLSLPQICSILNSTEMPHKQLPNKSMNRRSQRLQRERRNLFGFHEVLAAQSVNRGKESHQPCGTQHVLITIFNTRLQPELHGAKLRRAWGCPV